MVDLPHDLAQAHPLAELVVGQLEVHLEGPHPPGRGPVEEDPRLDQDLPVAGSRIGSAVTRP